MLSVVFFKKDECGKKPFRHREHRVA